MEAVLRRAEQAAYDTDEEKLLIEQAQSGNREAFEELVRKHDRDILRLASTCLEIAKRREKFSRRPS
jgi:hypothetical protein